MSDHTLKLILLSLFFYALGIATLSVIGFKRTQLPWVGSYTITVLGIAWVTQLKWVLLGGIVFMLLVSYYALWYFYRNFKCGVESSDDNTENLGEKQ
jgi:type III secretory pathway component EscU